MKKIINFLKKVFTHNYCDTCGLTKDNVYVVEYHIESGFLQCEKCNKETFKSEE
jgi:hypothetical protein